MDYRCGWVSGTLWTTGVGGNGTWWTIVDGSGTWRTTGLGGLADSRIQVEVVLSRGPNGSSIVYTSS